MKTWEQQYPLSRGGGVNIEQECGPVLITGWDQPEVKVTATCQSEIDLEDHVEVFQGDRGPGLMIRVKSRRSWFSWGQSIRLEVRVPVGTPCRVESGSGAVEVTGTQAPLEVETGSGNVTVDAVGHTTVETGSGAVRASRVNGGLRVETGSGGAEITDINGMVEVEVGSGNVSAQRINGDLHVETGSGRLLVEDVAGRAELETGSGSLAVERVKGAYLSVETGGGSVRLKAIDVAELEVGSSSGTVDLELTAVRPGGSYSVETGSGGVTVALPPDADVAVNAEASSGRITYAGLNLRVMHQESGELEAVLNQGRATLQIEAGSGTVQLRPLAAAPVQAPEPAPMQPAAQVMDAVRGDAALESSEQLKRIVAMVEEGKLTPDEAEELLRALDGEETPA